MQLPIYQVDAFTTQIFAGNPAAVMPLQAWLEDELLQAIAAENNLSETAYLVACDKGYELRWFTPAVEVDLCGHATLASAHVLFTELDHPGDEVRFQTNSGELTVTRDGGELTLDFPGVNTSAAAVDMAVCDALGAIASEVMVPGERGAALYVFEFEEDVAALTPDFAALKAATDYKIIATAPGDEHDFVSRFFGPQVGIDEDPVTGSAHCALVPYWAKRLGRNDLSARQISERGGELSCRLAGERVFMSGSAVTFMTGTVTL